MNGVICWGLGVFCGTWLGIIISAMLVASSNAEDRERFLYEEMRRNK